MEGFFPFTGEKMEAIHINSPAYSEVAEVEFKLYFF